MIRYDPHNPLFVWVENDGEFIPFRAARDILDDPMGGDVWRVASGGVTDAEREAREDAAFLADRMKRAQWVRPGTKRNRAVRAAEVDLDPLHLTSMTKSVARDERAEEPDDDEVIWDRGGGFSLLSDDDGVWDRLT